MENCSRETCDYGFRVKITSGNKFFQKDISKCKLKKSFQFYCCKIRNLMENYISNFKIDPASGS